LCHAGLADERHYVKQKHHALKLGGVPSGLGGKSKLGGLPYKVKSLITASTCVEVVLRL